MVYYTVQNGLFKHFNKKYWRFIMQRDPRFWVWGYVLDKVPGKAEFVPVPTSCSLETGADYLKCGSVFWMNPLHGQEAICDWQLERLQAFPRVVAGLTHIETNGPGLGGWRVEYYESAMRLARISLKYRNLQGVIIDDFRSPTGPSRYMTDEELKQIYCDMKAINPALKLYVVYYHTTQHPDSLLSCKDYFDGMTVWCWRSTDYFWNALYEDEIRILRENYADKELIQGQFLHAYGDGDIPQPMDQLTNQCRRIAAQLDRGKLDGWCALQTGWFSFQDHREQVEYVRNFWNWFRDTRTIL